MISRFWQFDSPLAKLSINQLHAALDITQPQRGLGEVQVAGETLAGEFLQLDLMPGGATAAEEVTEAYVREHDLIVSYDQLDERPFRPEVYWRAVESTGLGALETIVSVQTSLLDSRPAIEAVTRAPAQEVLSLVDLAKQEFRPVDLAREQPFTLTAAQGPACLLYRLPQEQLSYAELILPSDFQSLTLSSQADNVVELRYALFGQFLEKGVILRARRRGIFLARETDMHDARAACQAFMESYLPLTA